MSGKILPIFCWLYVFLTLTCRDAACLVLSPLRSESGKAERLEWEKLNPITRHVASLHFQAVFIPYDRYVFIPAGRSFSLIAPEGRVSAARQLSGVPPY